MFLRARNVLLGLTRVNTVPTSAVRKSSGDAVRDPCPYVTLTELGSDYGIFVLRVTASHWFITEPHYCERTLGPRQRERPQKNVQKVEVAS